MVKLLGFVGQSAGTSGAAPKSANETIVRKSTGSTGQTGDDAAAAAQSANGTTTTIIARQLSSATGEPTDAGAAQSANETIVEARTTLGLAAIMGILMGRARRSTGTVGQIAGGVGRLRRGINAGRQSPGSGSLPMDIADQSIANNAGQSSGTEVPLNVIINSPPADEIMEEPTESTVDIVGESAVGIGQTTTTYIKQSVGTGEQPSIAPQQPVSTVRQLVGILAWFVGITARQSTKNMVQSPGTGEQIAGGVERLTGINAGQPTVSEVQSLGSGVQIAGGAGQPTEFIVQSPSTGGQSIDIADQSIANSVGQSSSIQEPLISIANSPHTRGQSTDEIMEEPTESTVDNVRQSAGGMGQPTTSVELSVVDNGGQPSEAPQQPPISTVRQVVGFLEWFVGASARQSTTIMIQSPGTGEQSTDTEDQSIPDNVGAAAEQTDSTVDNVDQPTTTIEQSVETEGQPSEASTKSTNSKGKSVPYFTLIMGSVSFPCGNKRNIEVLRKQVHDLKKVRFVMKLLLYGTKNSKIDHGSPEIKDHVDNLNKTISKAEVTPSIKKYGCGLITIKITRKVPKTLEKLLRDVEKYSDPAASENSPVMLATKEFTDALEGEKISLIRVRGENLVLTTSELIQICTRAHEKNLFDDLAIATVSQDQKSYLYKLQSDLAEMLSLEFNQEEDISKRADLLRKRLNRWGRILIILEGVRVNINLEEVGIPVSKRCRVVMTLPNQHPSGEEKAEELAADAEPQIPNKQAVTFMEPNWVPKLEKNSIADRLVETCKEREINKLVANVEVWIHSYKETVRTIYIKSTRNEVEEVVISNGAALLPHPNA